MGRLKLLRLLTESAEHVAGKLREALDERTVEHLVAAPLSEDDKAAVWNLYLQGKPLCCKEGKKNLEAALDDPFWVEHINEWAYELLGCDPEYQPGGRWHEGGKSKLLSILKGEKIQ